MEKINYIIKRVLLFKNINEDKYSEVLKYLNARVKHYKKNEIISRAGGKINESGIIIRGHAHVSTIDYQGNRTILKELKIGHTFGESIVLSGINSTIAITAINDCSVLFLSIKKILLNDSFACNMILKENLILLLAHKNIALLIKNKIIAKKTIRERLLTFFYYHLTGSENNMIKTALSLEGIADYLCVNRSAMSRELGKMIKEGILTYNKNVFTILRKLPDNLAE